MMTPSDYDPYVDPVDPHRERLSIDELAAVTGVSRRTVHFYVQRRLIDPPLGRGRGRHWDRRHALQILQVRDLQRRGVALSDIATGEPAEPARRTSQEQASKRDGSTLNACRTPAEFERLLPRPSAGASVSSVVRIRIDDDVTVELKAGPEVVTGEFVDHLTAAVKQVIARHRGVT